ncbi:hypothetical protein H4684_003710 [Desulfomicrobium macestii]|jgi:hypothetical protein|uniref:Helix-turn-helix domain-containing protein n=1 Tax=Desulfomicrobium macestii TaxID=90731 RepID=A0ABR9H8H2_9BACT|nr:hypothetical protein [Desulfomicrobium macestii]
MVSTQKETERMWNEHQAADYLGMKVATLRFWRTKSRGPRYVKYPSSRTVRYDKADLDLFLESSRVEPRYEQ